MYKFNFEVYENMRDIKDSMFIDSDTCICSLECEAGKVEIIVCGEVRVTFENEVYRRYSEFPDELKSLMETNRDWELDDRVYVGNNNWFEIFYYDESGCVYSDVTDVEHFTEIQLLDECISYLDVSNEK